MKKKFDFSGWATKNDLECSDGRVIKKDAFAECDGLVVPLVWGHQYSGPENILGHALLKNKADGVFAYGTFNDTENGQLAKELVKHGDIKALSIFANKLKQVGNNVLHGAIKEVSLVIAGANPGATIENVSIAHSDDTFTTLEDEAIIYTGEFFTHSEDLDEESKSKSAEDPNAESIDEPENAQTNEQLQHDDNENPGEEIYNSMNKKQQALVHILVEEAKKEVKEEEKEEKEGGDNTMKHNVFDQESQSKTNTLTHSDVKEIMKEARRTGSLREAFNQYVEDHQLSHSIDTTGMEVAVGEQTYGVNDASMLFPDYKNVTPTPQWISRDMGWVQKVMAGVHRVPFQRIKSLYANITEDEARAKGYIKGRQKKEEVFTTLKRTTDPQTVYKKQKLDRDDIIDAEDFDIVAWIKGEMEVMLDEELARAILIGDGRPSDSDDKISPDHIRPIVTDVPLFNTKVTVTVAAADDAQTRAKAKIDAIIRARKHYKGSGNPTFYTTEDELTEMLLIEDGIGHKLYKSESELATALRVKEIVTVEPMTGYTVDDKQLVGTIVNLVDYTFGNNKLGQKTMFEDFDIDFNQQKYLLETRKSGAMIKPFSALTILLEEE